MIMPTILAGLLVIALATWILVEAVTSRRSVLALAIPFLLACPFGLYIYTGTLLGRAQLGQPPANGCKLIFSYADDSARAVYALMYADGEQEPRFYKVTADFEKNRKAFADAEQAVLDGNVIGCSPPAGADAEGGTVEFYKLPPVNLPQK